MARAKASKWVSAGGRTRAGPTSATSRCRTGSRSARMAAAVRQPRAGRVVTCCPDMSSVSQALHRCRWWGGSEEVPPALAAQVPVIEEVLAAAGVATAGAPGYEADDVIGTLTARAGGPVEIVTGDRDLFQLVDDERPVRVVYTLRGLTNLDVVDESAIAAKYHIPGRAYADFAVLRGDPSDGLPGVAGVGEKTAAALVRTFGTVEAMLAAIEAGHGGFPMNSRPKLAAARDYLSVAPAVTRVATDAPVPDVDGTLPPTPAAPDRLAALDERWDLGSSLRRALSALADGPR